MILQNEATQWWWKGLEEQTVVDFFFFWCDRPRPLRGEQSLWGSESCSQGWVHLFPGQQPRGSVRLKMQRWLKDLDPWLQLAHAWFTVHLLYHTEVRFQFVYRRGTCSCNFNLEYKMKNANTIFSPLVWLSSFSVFILFHLLLNEFAT